jgi:hypothetical protein
VLEHLQTEIRAALARESWTLALMGSITIPDTCGVLRDPDIGVGERYERWFDNYVAVSFDTGNPATSLSGQDCYQLRCSLLHENSQVFARPPEQRRG